jgi:hypothetical protein
LKDDLDPPDLNIPPAHHLILQFSSTFEGVPRSKKPQPFFMLTLIFEIRPFLIFVSGGGAFFASS